MKFNFRKIAAVTGSILMAGMTAGVAAAANFPVPFVDNGVADVAIVYGTGSGVSSLDMVQAGNIQTTLGDAMPSTGTTTVVDGDSFQFEKTSTKYHLGDNVTDVVSSSLDEDELPTLLGDGKYIDNDNDEFDYTQKINMSATFPLTMFEDNDYEADEPSVGFKIASAANVLTYTLTMSDQPYLYDLTTSNLPMMGREYYVLSNSTSGSNIILTLLDSASTTVLSEGEVTTIAGKTASIEFIGSNQVKLNVDGEVTNTLAASETFRLTDGSYIGIKDILYSSKEGSISKVEFSVGQGKLVLTSGSDIKMNDIAVTGVSSLIGSSSDKLTSIAITWAADEELFIAEDTEAVMPGFEAVKISYTGLTYPAEEVIEVKQGANLYATLNDFPLKDGPADIDFLYATTAGTFVGLGKDADEKLVTAATGATLTFDRSTDSYFVASWSDDSDAESYLLRFTNFVIDGTDNKTDLQYYKAGAWVDKKTGVKDADTVSIGNVDLTITTVSKLGSTQTVLLGNNSVNTNFNTLYSEEGMRVYLPYEAANSSSASGVINFTANNGTAGFGVGTLGHNGTSFYLVMREEDKSENKGAGDWINVTIGWDSSTTAEVEVSAVDTTNTDAASTEIQQTNVFRDFTYTALASEILYTQPDSGQKSVKIIYHGDEVAAGVYITSADATLTSTGASALGDVLVKDSEVATVSDKNLVIVGGSCINSAAATALGGAYCGTAFTDATGVGAGQFLVKGYDGAFTTGKLALVVAGYEAADTVNAATYLRDRKSVV